jgi:hypothetical protein
VAWLTLRESNVVIIRSWARAEDNALTFVESRLRADEKGSGPKRRGIGINSWKGEGSEKVE